MDSLADVLLSPNTRAELVGDCADLINTEVQSKSGLSGIAIKTAFKVVKRFKPGMIPSLVDALLEEFVAELEPFYADFRESNEDDIQIYLTTRKAEVANTLLVITDRRAETSKHKTLVKAYRKLRPQAEKQVVAAMPRIGSLLARHGL